MNYEYQNGTLTIALPEKIDQSSADAVNRELFQILEQTAAERQLDVKTIPVALNAEQLVFISSIGLRIILKLCKQQDSFRVFGVNPDVYEIFEMTGFSEIMTIEKAFRTRSVDGCEIIGKGAKGTVYRVNEDTVIKVYQNPDSLPSIQRERELARRAFILGIPTAISYDIVKVGDLYGSVFELLDAGSFSQLIEKNPDKLDFFVREYALLLRRIHQTVVKADEMPDIKDVIHDWLRVASAALPKEDIQRLTALVDATPDVMTMLHCDYHTNNVMFQKGETLLIDMDSLSHGHPIFELANTYITYVDFGIEDPTFVEKFIGLPYATCLKIWEKFLPIYLDTTDAAVLRDVENKARLLAMLRHIRHKIRRGEDKTEMGQITIERCRKGIHELLPSINTLTF